MKKILEAIKNFFITFFEELAPSSGKSFRVRAEVLKKYVVSRPGDGEKAHCITEVLLDDVNMIEKYGLAVEIDSEYYFNTAQVGDHISLWVKENPDYDPEVPHSQTLILSDD